MNVVRYVPLGVPFAHYGQGSLDDDESGMGKVPIEELLKLSVSERIQLVEDLWDSIAAEQRG